MVARDSIGNGLERGTMLFLRRIAVGVSWCEDGWRGGCERSDFGDSFQTVLGVQSSWMARWALIIACRGLGGVLGDVVAIGLDLQPG